eukprot:gene6463-39891_t
MAAAGGRTAGGATATAPDAWPFLWGELRPLVAQLGQHLRIDEVGMATVDSQCLFLTMLSATDGREATSADGRAATFGRVIGGSVSQWIARGRGWWDGAERKYNLTWGDSNATW